MPNASRRSAGPTGPAASNGYIYATITDTASSSWTVTFSDGSLIIPLDSRALTVSSTVFMSLTIQVTSLWDQLLVMLT